MLLHIDNHAYKTFPIIKFHSPNADTIRLLFGMHEKSDSKTKVKIEKEAMVTIRNCCKRMLVETKKQYKADIKIKETINRL